jgi:hypothetical protein
VTDARIFHDIGGVRGVRIPVATVVDMVADIPTVAEALQQESVVVLEEARIRPLPIKDGNP